MPAPVRCAPRRSRDLGSRPARTGRWGARLRTLLRYALTGGFTSLLDLSLFSFLGVVLHVHEIPANVASTLTTVSISYLINRTFVFRSARGGFRSFLTFASATLVTGLIVQSLVITGFLALMSTTASAGRPWTIVAAKLVAMSIGAVGNFISYRFIFTRGAADPS